MVVSAASIRSLWVVYKIYSRTSRQRLSLHRRFRYIVDFCESRFFSFFVFVKKTSIQCRFLQCWFRYNVVFRQARNYFFLPKRPLDNVVFLHTQNAEFKNFQNEVHISRCMSTVLWRTEWVGICEVGMSSLHVRGDGRSRAGALSPLPFILFQFTNRLIWFNYYPPGWTILLAQVITKEKITFC